MPTIALSPNGQLLALPGANHTVKIYLTADGTLLQTLVGHTDDITGLAFSHDGTLLASGAFFNGTHDAIKLWNVSNWTVVRELSGQLIVTQTPENQRNLVKLLEQLRETRAIQVTIETRFLKVQRNFIESVGVDFDFQYNPHSDAVNHGLPVTEGAKIFSGGSSMTSLRFGVETGFGCVGFNVGAEAICCKKPGR